MGAIASQITSLTIVYSTFFRAQIKENIKAPRHWPLWGEFTCDRWIPSTNGQKRGKCFHLMTLSWLDYPRSTAVVPDGQQRISMAWPVSSKCYSCNSYFCWKNTRFTPEVYSHMNDKRAYIYCSLQLGLPMKISCTLKVAFHELFINTVKNYGSFSKTANQKHDGRRKLPKRSPLLIASSKLFLRSSLYGNILNGGSHRYLLVVPLNFCST